MNLSPCTDPTPLVHLGFAESPSSLANPNSSHAVPGTVGNPHAGSESHSPSFPHSSALPALRNLLPRVLSTTVSAEGWEASSSFHPFCISLLFRAQVVRVLADTCTQAGEILFCSSHTESVWICICRRQLDSRDMPSFSHPWSKSC